jgi:hypothetical protein
MIWVRTAWRPDVTELHAALHRSTTCSISGMCLWRDTPYAFIPSATSVYRNACFTERPAPLTPLFASMMMSSCSRMRW